MTTIQDYMEMNRLIEAAQYDIEHRVEKEWRQNNPKPDKTDESDDINDPLSLSMKDWYKAMDDAHLSDLEWQKLEKLRQMVITAGIAQIADTLADDAGV